MCRRAHGYGEWAEWQWASSRSSQRTMTTAGNPPTPRTAAPARAGVPDSDLLVADRDREQVVDLLKRATTEGRLTIDEFGERAGEAYRARTGAELHAVLRQLPYDLHRLTTTAGPPPATGQAGPPAGVATARANRHRSAGVSPLLVVALVFAMVALASGGHVFVAWPLVWMLVFVGRRAWRRPHVWS